MGTARRIPLVAVFFGGLLSGCSHDTVTTPPTPPPPPAPVTVVVAQGSLSGLEPGGAAMAPFTTDLSGTLEIVLDWTLASNNLDLILTRGDCTPEQLIALECDVAAIASSTTAKPERASIASAAAGAYTLFVANRGDSAETFSFEALLTTVPAASVARP
jgi:hypothetical protein